MPETIPRVVFDCNVIVQGIGNRNSPARKALRLFFDGVISVFISEAILQEIRDVPADQKSAVGYRASMTA